MLDGIGLNRLSADGRELMRKVAERFDIPELDLPTIAGPFLGSARDLDAFMPYFDEWSEAATLLRKDWDEAKHPWWDAGTPESQGGRFKPRDASGVGLQEGRSARRGGGRRPPSGVAAENRPTPGIGHNNPFEIPEQEPPTKRRYQLIKEIGRWMVEAVRRGETQAARRCS